MSMINSGYAVNPAQKTIIVLFVVILFSCYNGLGQTGPETGKVFSKSNLVAWCIVPFDSKHRNPEERAQMLNKLGITKLAYDWREEHVPQFDEEMEALKKHHIELQAFWMPYGPDPVSNEHYPEILALLKRHKIKTQLWWSYGSSDDALKNLAQEERVQLIGEMVLDMAADAEKIGCTVGLYGHGGWFGEPENQLAILAYVKAQNVGIVYNFNHAEEQVDRFVAFFPAIVPRLIALNIAGLKKGPPGKVVAVGEGDSEKEMIRIIAASEYRGTIGIINEDTAPDAEVGLQMNIDGLKNILKSLGYTKALKSYQ
ncbi:sugar phosphate isomerase/epimerase family protein [Flavihumibacter profundi]|jgi:hypothetical protein|uniref:sugar phosphate isomerase/epimerase family protein n=1 Tax=Flavihumibacter profundi TaxID=2716883 RepID=UPI001CC602E3|nr:hypothetical protein [Flavihumibacter profundi]MBZ5855560.1 hypothetical protein [Flavihumibacter profundi]